MIEEKEIHLKVLGCSDAFCSGGRRHTSFLLKQQNYNTLIDCGATTPLALKANKMNSNDIDCIVLSHFHGDHYGGLPFLLLEAAKVLNRKKTLTLISPPGLKQRLVVLLGALYPGSDDVLSTLPLQFISFEEGVEMQQEKFNLRVFKVQHTTESQPHGVRLDIGGKVLSFSGDTAWHENLIKIAEGADLFICECNFFEHQSEHHLNYEVLKKKENLLKAKKIMITHLGEEMLKRIEEVHFPALEEDQEILV
ncbi:MBL fold metallo-hydrolase [Nafulsella turpanensis]|uniref:MBL fold metallo-hydrolase n=1 Tax=Nafulsella turpanensis TaxID=1265690 RepID=UPI00135F179E|nr:MBL fold metallo-hydrolase [Nafulsella turpanensis]